MSSSSAFDEAALAQSHKEKSRTGRLRGLAVFGAATVMVAAMSIVAAPATAITPSSSLPTEYVDDDGYFIDGHWPCYSDSPAPGEGADGITCMFGGWHAELLDCAELGEESIAVSEWDHYHCLNDISTGFALFIYDTYAPYI